MCHGVFQKNEDSHKFGWRFINNSMVYMHYIDCMDYMDYMDYLDYMGYMNYMDYTDRYP